MSLARKHFERMKAEREAAAAASAPARAAAETVGGDTVTAAGMPLADRMLITLRGHKAALKGIQSRQKKIEAKIGFLPDYVPYVDGILAADNGGQDTVLVTVMLWRIDAGQYEAAMQIASYAIRHDLAMPEGFARDLPTTLLEELAEKGLEGGDTSPELRDALDMALALTEDLDMHDEVRAKALKALGGLLQESDPGRAVEVWTNALQLDAKCGVKTQLERLKKQISAADAASGSAGGDAGA